MRSRATGDSSESECKETKHVYRHLYVNGEPHVYSLNFILLRILISRIQINS